MSQTQETDSCAASKDIAQVADLARQIARRSTHRSSKDSLAAGAITSKAKGSYNVAKLRLSTSFPKIVIILWNFERCSEIQNVSVNSEVNLFVSLDYFCPLLGWGPQRLHTSKAREASQGINKTRAVQTTASAFDNMDQTN